MPLKLALSFVGIVLIAAAIIWFPLPNPGSKARVFASAVTAGVLLLVWSGVFMTTLVRHALGVCPPASLFFEPGELLGEERWRIIGRRYRGQRAGHPVEIFFFPGQSVRRPLVVMEIPARTAARLGAGRAFPLAAGVGGQTLRTEDPELAGVIVVSPDPAAAQSLLRESAVRAALGAICADPVVNGAREVALLPDRVRVRWHPVRLDPSEVHRVLELAAALAENAKAR